VVSDDHGGPIAGAMVSALGTVTVAVITDATGFFSIDALPSGDYTLQAHRTGFLGSSRATVRVGGLLPALQRLQLRRLNSPVATSGTAEAPVPTRPIMAAGFGLPEGTLADQADASETSSDTTVARDDHPHNETAFRLRHIKRSILKDTAPIITVVERDGDLAPGSLFERAMDSAASMATTFFTDLPFSGEVNLLTTGAFGPGEMFSGDLLPRGVAYMAIGAPTPAGDWSVRAAMNQGDLSSWIVAGAFQSRVSGAETAHVYRFGYSYSAQDYLGGNPAALKAAADGSRNVGELFALDRWSIAPALTVEYGGRYGRYDYLRPGGLFSPKVGVIVEPLKNTHISATIAQRMLAPGAEEFVAWTVAATRAHVRAARRPGTRQRIQRRARALHRPHDRARVRVELRGRRPPVLPERRRSAGHALRPQRPRRAAVGRALLRRECGLARRRRLGGAPQQHAQARQRFDRLQRHARTLDGPRRHG
jgi:hypothetical protein